MQKNHIKKSFKLEGYILDKIEYQNNLILLHCHTQKRTMKHKGETSHSICEIRERKLYHMMIEDELVMLITKQRRFYFKKHKKRLWEQLPNVEKRKQCTNTFQLNTLRELQRDNYSGTGRKRGKSGMFTMRLLDRLDMAEKWPEKVERIGLDGKFVRGKKQVHHFVDLDKKKTIATFPEQKQNDVKKNF